MLFSIIVPAYNIAAYIDACVISVISQNCCDWELILVDDGSTDDTGARCDKYAEDNSAILVIHKENGGLSDARNEGMKAASGDYIVFLDGDDMLTPNALDNIKENLKDSPYVLMGRYFEFLEHGKICMERFAPDGNMIKGKSSDFVVGYLLDVPNYRSPACFNIYKRSLLMDNGLFFKKGIYHEDEQWTPRVIVCAETFSYLDEPFYMYRVNREYSIMNVHNVKRDFDKIAIAKELHDISKCENLSAPKQYFLRCRAALCIASILMYCFELSKQDRKKILKEVSANKYLLADMKVPRLKVQEYMVKYLGVTLTSYLYLLREKLKQS